MTLPFDWRLYIEDRETYTKMLGLAGSESGIFLAGKGGTLEFRSDSEGVNDGAQLASHEPTVGVTKEELQEAWKLFLVAKNCKVKRYDALTDIVIYFTSEVRVREKLTDGRYVSTKAWWVRPGSRTVRHVNLEDTEDALLKFAIG